MTFSPNLDQMTPEQLRALAEQAMQLLSQVDTMGQKIHCLETVNEHLAHEIASSSDTSSPSAVSN